MELITLNRAERRRNNITTPEKAVMIKVSDIEKIKDEAAERARRAEEQLNESQQEELK